MILFVVPPSFRIPDLLTGRLSHFRETRFSDRYRGQDVYLTGSVQAGEGYPFLAGWSAFSRWRYLSGNLRERICLACLPCVLVDEIIT